MNTQFLAALLQNPGTFIGEFLIVPLATVAFAYALVRWLTNKNVERANAVSLENLRNIFIVDVISALIRVLAISTFAGQSALKPSAETGAMAVYFLLIPAIVSYAFLKLTEKGKAAGEKNTENNKVAVQSSVDEDALFAEVAREIVRKDVDEGLWAKAFALENGDEHKTKAHYIRLRVEQLAKAESATSYQTSLNKSAGPSSMQLKYAALAVAIAVIVFATYSSNQTTQTAANESQTSKQPAPQDLLRLAIIGSWICHNTKTNYRWKTTYYEDGIYIETLSLDDKTFDVSLKWDVRDKNILVEHHAETWKEEYRVSVQSSGSAMRLYDISANGEEFAWCIRQD